MKIHFIILLFLSLFVSTFGQASSPLSRESPKTEGSEQIVKVKTLLVNIPIIATDKNGQSVSGLTKDNFLIFEDGESQPITFFADEEASMSIAVLIDCSASTSRFAASIQNAARNFIKILRPEDQALVSCFTDKTYIFNEFTSDQNQLREAIDKTSFLPRGESNMLDAVYQIVTKNFTSVKGRKAIIALTDGAVWGRISTEKLLSILAQSDVLVYPVLFSGEARKESIQFMNSMAEVTGGKIYRGNLDNVKKIFQAITEELKTQYLIGFYPQNIDDGKDHKISVGINLKNIVIRTKHTVMLKSTN